MGKLILSFFILYSINIHCSGNNEDSLVIKRAAAKGDDSEYFNNFILSMNNIYGELKNLRNVHKLNSDNIILINANQFKKYKSDRGLDNLITKNNNEIASLRNYLKNSADEKNIQVIKETLTLHGFEADDIIGVHINRNGGAVFYYYKQK